MRLEISHSGIKKSFDKGLFVAVEFQNRMNTKCRAIVQGLPKRGVKVKTIYGTVEPEKIFAFSTSVEAMNFVNEKPKEN